MRQRVFQTALTAGLAVLSLSCSSPASQGDDNALGSGGAAAPGSGGAIAPPGSGGMAAHVASGSGGVQPMGSGGMIAQPTAGHAATGGSVAPPPVVDGGMAPSVDAGIVTAAGKLLPTDNVDAMGPYPVTIDMSAGPNMGWIAHPTDLGKNGELHPIFTWGCGGGSTPDQYKDHLERIASHGFVVEAHVSTGDAADHKVIVDWLIEQNEKSDSTYFHKLDVSKIAVGGHSMGSIATFAFEGGDDRVTTSIHVAGGSFDGQGYKSLKTPTLMVDGSGDTLALSNTQADYAAATVPVFITVIEGSDHIYAARDGLAPIVAWLRWWLGGETERKSMFIGPDCDFCKGNFKSMSKNW